MADETEEIAEEAEAGQPKKPGMMTLVKAIAFISVIVLLQIAAASVLVPTAKETTDIANQLAATAVSHDIQNEENPATEDAESETLASTDTFMW